MLLRSLIFWQCLVISTFCHAQSYEGHLHPHQFIWMDIRVTADTLVDGSYFNKNGGAEVRLNGLKKAETFQLKAIDLNGSVVAEMTLVGQGDSLIGNWKKTGSKIGLPIRFFQSNPSFKSYCRIPKADSLITTNGKNLASEMIADRLNPAASNPFEITFARHGVLGTKFSFMEQIGESTRNVYIYHAFDLKSKKQLELIKEIESSKLDAILNLLNQKAMLKVQEFKSNSGMSEEEWIQELGGAEKYQKAFEKTNLDKESLAKFRLDQDGIHILKDGYFGLSSSLRSLDLDLDILLAPSEIRPYIKKGSPLSF